MEKKLWEVIANQCAPVLADVKPSNLLILTSEEEEVFLQMEELPHVSSLCLYEGKNKSTWLLYRRDRLESALVWPQTGEFLEQYGYRMVRESLDEKLLRLQHRFAEYKEERQPFPHEMGVFLGYPLGDVKGFIEHHGKEYLCSGYWKVYQDEQKAKSTFQLYQSVRDAVLQLIMAGSNLYEISYQA